MGYLPPGTTQVNMLRVTGESSLLTPVTHPGFAGGLSAMPERLTQPRMAAAGHDSW